MLINTAGDGQAHAREMTQTLGRGQSHVSNEHGEVSRYLVDTISFTTNGVVLRGRVSVCVDVRVSSAKQTSKFKSS